MKMLKLYRKKVDNIDSKLIKLISKRLSIAENVAKIKSKNNMNIYQKDREAKLMEKIKEKSSKENIDQEFAQEIFEKILEESKKRQEKVLENDKY